MAILRAASALILCLLWIGCAATEKKEPAQPAETAPTVGPRRVGSITLVNEPLQFVLVDVGTLYIPKPGQALKSFTGKMESGILVVSPEAKPPFIVADVIKGQPQKGDDVFE